MSFNNHFLTVEDANSIIEHFGNVLFDYYVLDTRVLSTQDLWFAYDFITVSKSSDSIVFEIENSLWTGGYYIRDCNITPTVTSSNNTLIVSGAGLEYVVLVLELNTHVSGNSVCELTCNPVYTPMILPFYEDMDLIMSFVDKDETAVAGLSVKDKITEDTLTTDSTGEVTVPVGIEAPGLHDYILEPQDVNKINYYFPYQRIKVELPIILVNNEIIKDKKQLLTFKFLFDSDYSITDEMLFSENSIRLTVNNKVYEVESYSDACFSFMVNLEDFFYDTIELKLKLSGNDYLEAYSTSIQHSVIFETLDNVSDLKLEIENSDGADTIYYSGTDLNDLLYVNRDVRIEFTEPGVNNIPDKCFIVDNDAELIVDGLDYTGDAGLITLRSGSVSLLDCNVHNVPDIIVKGTGSVDLNRSVFSDNTGVVDAVDVDLYNSTFSLSDKECLLDGVLGFVKVEGACSVDYCQFLVDLDGVDSIPFVFLDVGKDASVNTVRVNNLLVNEAFPVRKCTSELEVVTSRAIFRGKSNKCFLWTVEDTNTVYSNLLEVEYV